MRNINVGLGRDERLRVRHTQYGMGASKGEALGLHGWYAKNALDIRRRCVYISSIATMEPIMTRAFIASAFVQLYSTLASVHASPWDRVLFTPYPVGQELWY